MSSRTSRNCLGLNRGLFNVMSACAILGVLAIAGCPNGDGTDDTNGGGNGGDGAIESIILNEDEDSSHLAEISTADAQIDVWGDRDDEEISAIRAIRTSFFDGAELFVQVDEQGRPALVHDDVGYGFAVNEYLAGNRADCTFFGPGGSSKRVTIEFSSGTFKSASRSQLSVGGFFENLIDDLIDDTCAVLNGVNDLLSWPLGNREDVVALSAEALVDPLTYLVGQYCAHSHTSGIDESDVQFLYLSPMLAESQPDFSPPTDYPRVLVANIPAGNVQGPMAISPDGRHLYVSNHGEYAVSVIDTVQRAKTREIPVSHPGQLAPGPHGAYVYVVNRGYDDNSLSVIRTSDYTLVATIPVGEHPQAVAAHPEGTHVYVSNYGESTISIIQTPSNIVVDTIPSGNGPGSMVFSPDGRYLYVSNYLDDQVLTIDTESGGRTTIATGDQPWSIAISPAGERVYVRNNYDEVWVISTSDYSISDTISIGGYVSGVAVTPDGRYLYTALYGGGDVVIVSTSNNQIVDRVEVGGDPEYIVMDPGGDYVYVSNEEDDVVHVIGKN